MAQHDYVISNGTGAAVRSDLNNALAAIVSQNSGATAPSPTYAFQFWADTTAGVLKLRNSANSAWITLFQLDGEWTTLPVENGTAAAPSIYFKDSGTDTGFYSPGTDQVAISTGGTGRLFIDSSGRCGIGNSAPSVNLDVAGSEIRVKNTSGSAGLTVSRSSNSSGAVINLNTGDTNKWFFGLRGLIDDKFYFYNNVAGNTALTIDESSRVGIGTTTPAPGGQGVHIHNSSAADSSLRVTNSTTGATDGDGFAIQCASDGTAKLRQFESTALTFETAATERARIDSAGRWLLGTSSTPNDGRLVVAGNSAFTSGTNSFGQIKIRNNNSAPSNGETIGVLEFSDSGSGNSATIIAARDGGTWTTNTSNPGRLVFSTTADGASSPTERMRIDNAGKTNIVSSSWGLATRVTASAGTSTAIYYGVYGATNTGDGTISYQVWSNGNVQNTNNSYTGISDIKLKENIVDAHSQWADIKALQVRNYNLKEGQTHKQIGLIAQEVELISPGLISESPDLDAEGNDLGTVTKAVNYSVLYMKAVKALQEAMERIETLEAKVAALESA